MQKSTLNLKPNFEVVYRGKMFEIVEWEGKPGIAFEAAVRAPGVRLIIETQKDGQPALLMTSEIRREVGGYDYRLPGGKVFDTLTELDAFRESGQNINDNALIAAKKEGKEEAGIDGGEYVLIDVQKAGASVEWDLLYFVVNNSTLGAQHLEDAEQGDIETVLLTYAEVFEKLKNKEINEGRSADVLWRYLAQKGCIEFKI